MTKNVNEISDADFEEQVLKSNVPVLVDFWAPWCAPCLQLGPVVDEVAGEYEGKLKVVKINISEHQQYATSFNVRAIPNLLLFKNGKVVDQKVGGLPKTELQNLVKKHV